MIEKQKSGLTEIRDGVFTIIPVINGTSKNVYIIREWYRRKRIGLSFCSGVVNYTFTDNWPGLLYFFKFNKKIKWDDQENYDLGQRTSKYPRDLIFLTYWIIIFIIDQHIPNNKYICWSKSIRKFSNFTPNNFL